MEGSHPVVGHCQYLLEGRRRNERGRGGRGKLEGREEQGNGGRENAKEEDVRERGVRSERIEGIFSNQSFKPVNLVWQAGQLAAVESQPSEIAHICHLVNKLIILRREGTY